MSASSRSPLRPADLRTAAWHLRQGGVAQVRRWWSRRGLVQGEGAGTVLPDGRLTFEPWPVGERPVVREGLRVGVILDDFSRMAFGFEWEQVELTPAGWREQVEGIDLLFVESAWHGNADAWQYHLTGSKAPWPALVELVEWCKAAGVPTVFWNKEDPAHFDDFLASARLFDHVFTTDGDRLPAYREALGHDRVGVLQFAAQSAIHNPVRALKGHQSRDVAFAGMYFAHRHAERREQMDLLLGGALDVSGRMERGLEIFSRQLGGDERYQFPAPFDERVVGSLDYARMLSAYRAYKVFLNVNTVVGSPTMCARRIFEITASGTPVVSTPSEAISAVFPADTVPQVSSREEAGWTVRALVGSPLLRDVMVHRAQRIVWGAHTYTHRADEVLRVAGVHGPDGRWSRAAERPTVSALVSTNRPHQLDHVLGVLGDQREVELEVLLLTHGFEVEEAEVRARAAAVGVTNLRLFYEPQETPLGACLNVLLDAAGGEVVAKIDDDDLYGPFYLRDQLDALRYSGADVVGKQAHFVHIADSDVTALRFGWREHRFTDFVMGPTIVARTPVARAARFAEVGRGEDSAFLARVVAGGGRVYAADRFGFVLMRGASGGPHTWQASDAEILASAEVVAVGLETGSTLLAV